MLLMKPKKFAAEIWKEFVKDSKGYAFILVWYALWLIMIYVTLYPMLYSYMALKSMYKKVKHHENY